ncbi:MAG: neutral/alkaline non-lysosomal ceramidase N-terminal domain-containing protein, partial [Dethiobacteria bacterium]
MYEVGFAKRDITVVSKGYAMHGYGMWFHRQKGVRNRLYTRVFYFKDEADTEVVYVCLDLGYVTHAIRKGVEEELAKRYPHINPHGLIMACTHTHSGYGGCAHEPLYNVVTPGFHPHLVETIVKNTMEALDEAVNTAQPSEVTFTAGDIPEDIPVAWNRTLYSYNQNPDVVKRTEEECHLAVNREMLALTVKRNGTLAAIITWFGVHGTCLGNRLSNLDGDNKGYASRFTEEALSGKGVAIFAQAACGDVSPHYHGPGQISRRKKIKGEAEYEYAMQNGRYQSDHALKIAGDNNQTKISGNFDYEMIYADFSDIHVAPEFANGQTDAYTSEPCHGISFLTGTVVDGPGMPIFLGKIASLMADSVKNKRLHNLDNYSSTEREYYQRLYAAQGNKSIALESGKTQRAVLGLPLDHVLVPGFADPMVKELKREYKMGAMKEHGMVAYVLPVQIVIFGNVAIIACPGEFTNTAGKRVVEAAKPILKQRGIEHVIFNSYANDYMGYVTTREEFQVQAYEGGHTVFGQWSLGAFQTIIQKLAKEMLKPKD